jgi:TPR repeat protein
LQFFIPAILIRILVIYVSKFKWKYVIGIIILGFLILANDLTRKVYVQARLNQMHLTRETYREGRDAEQKGIDLYSQKKYQEALILLRKAADLGFPRAESYLVPFYRRGLGVKKNIPEAIKWFEKSAVDEDKFKDTFIGFGFRRGGNKSKMIGQNYENGTWFPKDYGKALKWYLKAYSQGDKAVMKNIGLLYEKGLGVPQNYEEAMKWYLKAQKEGEHWSLVSMGLLYENGHGVPQNYKEAMKRYLKAEERENHFKGMGIHYGGNQEAENRIGLLYEKGLGAPQDYHEAMKWFQKAAYYQNSTAEINIGFLYENGWGVSKDYQEAMKWYQRALSKRDKEAQKHIDDLKKIAK